MKISERDGQGESGCGAGAGHQLGDRVSFASPHAEEEDFCPRGVFEDVKDAGLAFDFEESRTTRIRARSGAAAEQETQLRHKLRRMLAEVFDDGRFLLHSQHDQIPGRTQLIVCLTYKDV